MGQLAKNQPETKVENFKRPSTLLLNAPPVFFKLHRVENEHPIENNDNFIMKRREPSEKLQQNEYN